MNLIGKIFVFAVFIMSLALMVFSAAIYTSNVDWKATVERTSEEVTPDRPLGLRYQLEEAEKQQQSLREQILLLEQQVNASEAARDQVIAKLQSALAEKSGLLDTLRADKANLEKETQSLGDQLKTAQVELKQASEDVRILRGEVEKQQGIVDTQVGKAATLAAELEEQKAFLALANERKAQLERQVANARLLLQQSGLSVDSPPRDRMPTLDGDVLAVAEGMIQVSLGSDDGIQVGHELEVYRGNEYVGRAVVRAVRPDHAIAEPVRQYMRGIVQRGDKVTTRLKA